MQPTKTKLAAGAAASRVSDRIAAARMRANGVNRALAAGSIAAFAVVLVLARVTHPGHATRADPSSSLSSGTSEQSANAGSSPSRS